MSRNLEGQWINFLISFKYFKGGKHMSRGGKCPPPHPHPPKRNPVMYSSEHNPGSITSLTLINNKPLGSDWSVIRHNRRG